MISRIRGMLVRVLDGHALIENGGVAYELLLPSALAERLRDNGSVGEQITFETIYYIEAGDKKAAHFPRLVGFTEPVDREFFSLLNQVNGLGVKKTLKCLVLPIKDIATAIENRDTGTLSRLPGIGGRLAEKIVAELHGKTAKFALARESAPLATPRPPRGQVETEAIEVLLQLQYRRSEAEEMVGSLDGSYDTVEKLIAALFRNGQREKSQVTG